MAYARKHGIILFSEGSCQFCGSEVQGGVFECHANAQRLTDVLHFNNPKHYETRFLSVDAMALQHCELHGPWNNHIHLTRLSLIFENKVTWEYSKTAQLSNIINQYKKNECASLVPPPRGQRGRTTSSDLLKTASADECIAIVRQWAEDVYYAFEDHHALVTYSRKIYGEILSVKNGEIPLLCGIPQNVI